MSDDPSNEGNVDPQATDPGANQGTDQGADPTPGATNPLNSDAGGDPTGGDPGQAAPEGSGGDPEGTPTPWFQGDQLPDNWREQIAGEDSKTLNMLKRVDGINTLVKNYVEAQETIRKGQNAAPAGPPEDEAKLAEWREANNIPAAADAYEFKMEDGLVLSDGDKEDLQPLLESFHGMNLNNEQVGALVNQYYKMESAQSDRLIAQDHTDQVAVKEVLEKQWGGDFDTNMNLIKALIGQEFPSDIADDLIGARLANGKGLFNDAGVLAAFAKIARTVNPVAALVPSGHNPMQTLNDKIKELETRMKDDPTWHKDNAAQQEYMDMVTARDQLNARHGG